MPPWMIAAQALARQAIRFIPFGLARSSAARTVALAGGGAAAGQALADPAGGLLPGFGGGGGGARVSPEGFLISGRRRRRRRALTASDRADIAFIAGALGPAAGKSFAVQLVAGLTR